MLESYPEYLARKAAEAKQVTVDDVEDRAVKRPARKQPE
jgi:hypothetical protein